MFSLKSGNPYAVHHADSCRRQLVIRAPPRWISHPQNRVGHFVGRYLVVGFSNLEYGQGPMVGNLVDTATRGANPHFAAQLHWLMGAATIGTALAILCFPTMVKLSSRMVVHFEAAGSIPAMVRGMLKRSKIRNATYYITPPSWKMAKRLVQHGMPRRLMLSKCSGNRNLYHGCPVQLVRSVPLSSQAIAASQSTGLINGIATILLTILIDPRISLLSDKSLRGEIRLDRMNQIYGCMLVSRLFGTLLAQLLLIPFAYWIGWIVSMM